MLTYVPRLRQHRLRLDDGRQVTIAAAGHGFPLVVVHGFSFSWLLYAQTLGRLAGMGFKVVALEVAGLGGPATPGARRGLGTDSRRLGQVVDQLGIRRALLAGHSLGGRLVVESAAAEPRRAVALLLVDASVGEPWDRLAHLLRLAPPALGAFAATFFADSLSTIPLARDSGQAAKLYRLALPGALENLGRPWRLLGPGLTALSAPPSAPLLEALERTGVPVAVLHGDRDFVVPLAAGRDAARRTGGELVVVHRATHSWLLQDPETLPQIVQHLLVGGCLGAALWQALLDAGLDPASATTADVEAACYQPDAPVHALTADQPTGGSRRYHRAPYYRWSRLEPEAVA